MDRILWNQDWPFTEHCNEPVGSIKCKEFLDELSVLLASKEGLCCVEYNVAAVTSCKNGCLLG